jgi:hypothetical protein
MNGSKKSNRKAGLNFHLPSLSRQVEMVFRRRPVSSGAVVHSAAFWGIFLNRRHFLRIA